MTPWSVTIIMKQILILMIVSLTVWFASAEGPYDFRTSDAYKKLFAADKQRLEQVHRDFVLLWGALDMYADEHGGNPPATLDALVPKYLAELPTDPFATQQTARGQDTRGYTQSKGRMGYGLAKGSAGNRAWCIASVGLPDFPYLAERGNVGLYICKGTWISGNNPSRGKLMQSVR
jgi:hypothetical protein